jgi:hypothetical protein
LEAEQIVAEQIICGRLSMAEAGLWIFSFFARQTVAGEKSKPAISSKLFVMRMNHNNT